MVVSNTPENASSLAACPRGTLVGLHGQSVLLWPSPCRKWNCNDCGPRKARVLASRIALTKARRFITLTTRYRANATPLDELDRMRAAWRTMWKRIRRRQGKAASGYLMVVESTRRGWPHLHIVADCAYVPQRLLSAWWNELTSSPVVDVRKIESERGMARYLAKYLTKQHAAFSGRRRYSATWYWLPAAPKEPLEPEELPILWRYRQTPLDVLSASLEAQGYTSWRGCWWPPGSVPT